MFHSDRFPRGTPRLAAMSPKRLSWSRLYREVELYKSAVRLYTKPLFNGRKAHSSSSDAKSLFDFARHGLRNLDAIHHRLMQRAFHFREALALHRNFNGKRRTLYVYPWEERLVSLLLYRLLNRALDRHFSGSSYAYRWRGFGVDSCQTSIALTLRQRGLPVHVIKRDISNFFPSIDHDILLEQLRHFVEPDDYLFELLRQSIHFSFRDEGESSTAVRGVPFGTATACLLANIYLMNLDRRLESITGTRFFRYADDLLVLSPDADGQRRAAEIFQSEMRALRLTSNTRHESDLVLTGANGASGGFRHLGLQFREDGSVGLSRDKFRKIRNLFRFAFRRHGRRFQQRQSPHSRARLAVDIAQRVLTQGVRNVAIIDYYLRHVTDEGQLRQLDQWLAEEVLSRAFEGGHKKSYFRQLPFRELRKMGLPSLVHRRRLIRHGHIESSFFVWKSRQTNPRYGGRAARPLPSEAPVFSQSHEAVAKSTW